MATLKDFDNIPNGAQFFSADLHVHSFGGSHDISDSSMTPEAIVDEAVRSKIAVLAITDHNSTTNTKKSIDYAQGNYPDQILVLAGVEITTAHGHLLCYFAPDSVDKLQTFVARLSIVNPGHSDSHTAMSMSDVISESFRLGGLCVAAHIDRKTGFESSAIGYPNWKKDILGSKGLVGLEFADAANLSWYSADDVTPEKGERQKLLAHRSHVIGTESPLAQVQNSDAHTLAEFASGNGKRNLTRIKLSALTFESVRTAFADPVARIRPTALLPKSYPRLLAMQVSGGFLNGQKYRFSDNLNCFVGGRGTGKSTALKCIAHALGLADQLEDYDNCPDSVILYCQDSSGVLYRYERMRGSEPTVKAKDEGSITDVPVDTFVLEYFGQGDLAEVAKDPLTNARQFQEFLDRNTRFGDLFSREAEVVSELRRNSSQLIPHESLAGSKHKKKSELEDITKKLQIAEEGKLKELVAVQTRIGAEKTLSRLYEDVAVSFRKGITLASFVKNTKQIEDSAGERSGETNVEGHFARIRAAVEKTNSEIQKVQCELSELLRKASSEISGELVALSTLQARRDLELASKIETFQKQGLAGSVADLQKLVKRQGQLALEIGKIEQSEAQRLSLREERAALLKSLLDVRDEITEKRKALVRDVNRQLSTVIDGYLVALKFSPSGITDEFSEYLRNKMEGSYIQDEAFRRLCIAISPQQLVDYVNAGDPKSLSSAAGISVDSANKLIERLPSLETIHYLETIWKPPCPSLHVVSRTPGAKAIPVNQLSDGQKHTIFLTIAMLAESDAPLVIDQPEDDLDNAFIYSSVVETLRKVKERRQVILVTHNANIAVLGDAELLFPMQRVDDGGAACERGAIDKGSTRDAVQKILEGGEDAFRKRMQMYGF